MALTTYPEYTNENFKIPSVEVPSPYSQTQNNIQDVMNRQLKAAQDFRSNMPQYQKNLYNSYETGARSNLAKSIKDVQKDYNRRGLLRSGGRIGAEFGQRAQTEGDLANANLQIWQGLNQEANTLENNALNTAYTLAGSNPNLGSMATGANQAALSQALGNLQAQQSLYGGIFSGLGKGAGYLLGSR